MRALVIIALALASSCRTGENDRTAHAQGPAAEVETAVVTVIAADWMDGRLVPATAGSGTIVSADGAVLTNHHILHDERGDRLHDAFIIARARADASIPVHTCTGHPGHGALDRARDLAVVRCDRDMHGQPFIARDWPTVSLGRTSALSPGEPVWILGYPRSRGGALAISAGHLSGWTGENGGAGHDFLTARARIAPGASGGAAVDRDGALIGVATGFRLRTRITSVGAFPAGRIALIRPIERALPVIEAAGRALADPSLPTPEEARDASATVSPRDARRLP